MKGDAVRHISPNEAALSDRFHAATGLCTHSDWDDVLRRLRPLSRPRRARFALRTVLIAALVAAVIAVPALAISSGVIGFSTSPGAPGPVQVQFGELDRLGSALGPGVDSSDTREVYTFQSNRGPQILAAAPARNGFCYGIEQFFATCENAGSPVIDPFYNQFSASGPVLITGAIQSLDVSRATINFANGGSADAALVSVSTPIDATFIFYEVPSQHAAPGTRPTTLVAYNGSDAIGQASFDWSESTP